MSNLKFLLSAAKTMNKLGIAVAFTETAVNIFYAISALTFANSFYGPDETLWWDSFGLWTICLTHVVTNNGCMNERMERRYNTLISQ